MRVFVIKSTYLPERSVFHVEVNGQLRELTEPLLKEILAGDNIENRILAEGALL